MKKMLLPSLLITGACVSGCVSMLSSAPPSIEMAYTTENPSGAGVVQVFEIGTNTVIQVRNIDTVHPKFIDEQGNQLKYQIFGQNAVLEGRHNLFRVVTLNGTTTVKRTAIQNAKESDAPIATVTPQPNAAVQAQKAAPASQTAKTLDTLRADAPPQLLIKHKDDTPEQLQAEIDRMKAELNEIKKLLNRSAPVDKQAPVKKEQAEQTTIIVRFADNSGQFQPTPADQMALRDLTRTASLLTVTGYTDSYVPNTHARTLANLRAYAAKDYLVSGGVNAAKITVKAIPAGGFIADNRTKEGKAVNRRVEISAS